MFTPMLISHGAEPIPFSVITDPDDPGDGPENDSFSNAYNIYLGSMGTTKTLSGYNGRGYGAEYYYKFNAPSTGYLNIDAALKYSNSLNSYIYVTLFDSNQNAIMSGTASYYYNEYKLHWDEIKVNSGNTYYLRILSP